jgi:iron complex transport system ATP-binding protein
LNHGDKDAEVAGALGTATALEKPFCPISREALDEARHLARNAHALVLAPVPFGSGNLANLDLLDEALAAGKPVFIAVGIETRDYTRNRDAVARVNALLTRGATLFQDVADLIPLLPTC